MTPLHLEILLWYYGRAIDYPFEENATRLEYAENLVSSGLLYKSEGAQHYGIDRKGKFFVEYIMELPLPVQMWVMPIEEPA